VRRQFLPDAQRVETGVVGIAGKIFLDIARDRIAGPLLDGISLVAARGGLGLFVAIQEMTGGPVGSIGGNEPALVGTGNLYENTRSYLMWALSAKREKFGLADAEQADSAALAAAAARSMAGWSRAFRELVGLADPTTISCLPIRTSVPIAPWRTGRITLLGDAIHSMTPYRASVRTWRSKTPHASNVRWSRRIAASATSSKPSATMKPACSTTVSVPCAIRSRQCTRQSQTACRSWFYRD